MLSDFELQRLRAEKKRQEQAKSPAVEIAMRLSGRSYSERQVRQTVDRYIGGCSPVEIEVEKAFVDPVRDVLKAGGYIEED